MQKYNRVVAWLVVVLSAVLAPLAAGADKPSPQPKERIVMGWIESVVVEPWGVKLRAKLDTGAKTSSMHAQNIERFKRKGKGWVRFTLKHHDKGTDETRVFTMQRPLVREARVKNEKGTPLPRPVVSLEFCLGGVMYDTEFTLADRGHFYYPILLGRRFLKDVALVDPSATFLTTSSLCTRAVESQGKSKATAE